MPKGYTKEQLQELYDNFIGIKQGFITVVRPATNEENKKLSGNSKYWLCKCDCGKELYIKTAYIQGNAGRGDYKINSCGCLRKVRAFIASSTIFTNEDFDWLYNFYKEDWEKFSLLHQCFLRSSGIKIKDIKDKEEYKELYNYFWNDIQFNKIYNFWKTKDKTNTFYDLAKPSLDHKIPKSRGGENKKENFQFLTVYENLSKRDMTIEEWELFKKETNTISSYFIDEILKGGDINNNE